MPDDARSSRRRTIIKTEAEWERIYSTYLERLIPDVEELDYINAHQRPLYLQATNPDPDYDSYTHHD